MQRACPDVRIPDSKAFICEGQERDFRWPSTRFVRETHVRDETHDWRLLALNSSSLPCTSLPESKIRSDWFGIKLEINPMYVK
jgi:hypothetical protein